MIRMADQIKNKALRIGQKYLDAETGLTFCVTEMMDSESARLEARSSTAEYRMIICPNHTGVFSRSLGNDGDFHGGLVYNKRQDLNLVGYS